MCLLPSRRDCASGAASSSKQQSSLPGSAQGAVALHLEQAGSGVVVPGLFTPTGYAAPPGCYYLFMLGFLLSVILFCPPTPPHPTPPPVLLALRPLSPGRGRLLATACASGWRAGAGSAVCRPAAGARMHCGWVGGHEQVVQCSVWTCWWCVCGGGRQLTATAVRRGGGMVSRQDWTTLE